ncbi:MAG: cupin fold WbuC family metalloprotein [Bacteriovoracaceae bacterium]|jgi:cupin fold WbuC family metalloprotein
MSDIFEFIKIDTTSLSYEDIQRLVSKAKKTEQGSFRLNCHDSFEDNLQQMIICLTKKNGNIHRHKNTDEVISILEGRMSVTLFDEEFNEVKTIILDKENNAGILRIRKNTWHKNIPLDDFVVFHEISSGPFNPDKMEIK